MYWNETGIIPIGNSKGCGSLGGSFNNLDVSSDDVSDMDFDGFLEFFQGQSMVMDGRIYIKCEFFVTNRRS